MSFSTFLSVELNCRLHDERACLTKLSYRALRGNRRAGPMEILKILQTANNMHLQDTGWGREGSGDGVLELFCNDIVRQGQTDTLNKVTDRIYKPLTLSSYPCLNNHFFCIIYLVRYTSITPNKMKLLSVLPLVGAAAALPQLRQC